MNCYNHDTLPAIGICKHCNKGICKSCATDTGDGLACTATCLDEVIAVNQLIDSNKNQAKHSTKSYSFTGSIQIVLGVLIIAVTYSINNGIEPVISILGLFFIVMGSYSLYKGKSLSKKDKKETELID